MVPGDVDRVVAFHVLGAVGDAVAHNANRGRDRVDVLLLRHVFLEYVRLNCAGEFVQVVAAFLRQHDVHGQQDPRGRVDGHRYRNVFEIDAVEQRFHVGERIHRHAFASDFTFAHRVVGVVAHQRRHVEVSRQAGLTLRDEVFEPVVGVLTRAETGDLAHGPEAAAVHGRVRPASERVLSRQADVLQRRVGNIERGVGALDGKAAQGLELLFALGLFLQKRGDFVFLPKLQLFLHCCDVFRIGWCVHVVPLQSDVTHQFIGCRERVEFAA